MNRLTYQARCALGLLALSPLALAGCGIEDNLLEPQQPGVVQPGDIASAGSTGAIALYTGALGWLKNWTCGGPVTVPNVGNGNSQSMCMYADLLTDVWETSDTFTQRIDMDRRTVQSNDAEVTGRYATIQQARGFYRDALNSLKLNAPTEPERQADMYFAMGFTEMSMAEYFCNGIPLSETVNGVVTYSKPYTNIEVYNFALAHLDSAISLASGTNALAVRVKNAAIVAKGRTLVDLGRWADAATAVSSIATNNTEYALAFSQVTGDNAIWVNNGNATAPASARYVVGDSADISQNVEARIRNAIPFASSNDPRVPVTGTFKTSTAKGFDGGTPYVGARAFSDRTSATVLTSGVDARLIEAEAKLQTNDIAGMMTILNALRTSPPNATTMGGLTVTALAALPTPATQAAAVDLFFREKAYWQFARGARLGDLRRLIRQYGRTEDQTFPEGAFHKSPFIFGDDVNFSVPDSEKQNPNFTGCIDRKA